MDEDMWDVLQALQSLHFNDCMYMRHSAEWLERLLVFPFVKAKNLLTCVNEEHHLHRPSWSVCMGSNNITWTSKFLQYRQSAPEFLNLNQWTVSSRLLLLDRRSCELSTDFHHKMYRIIWHSQFHVKLFSFLV